MAEDICYIEFVSDKTSETAEFAKRAFGWEVQQMGDAYAEFRTGEGELTGGIRQEQPGSVPPEQRTAVYIKVEDINTKLGQVNAAGGATVIPRTDIGDGMGFFAFFTDPTGVLVGLYETPAGTDQGGEV